MNPIHHIGPAGSVYTSISDAGKHILHQNCQDYVNNTASCMMPPFFVNEYPELTHASGAVVPAERVQQKDLKDLNSHTIGECNERTVYKQISKIAQNSSDLLVLRSFNLRKQNCEILAQQYPDMKVLIDSFLLKSKGHKSQHRRMRHGHFRTQQGRHFVRSENNKSTGSRCYETAQQNAGLCEPHVCRCYEQLNKCHRCCTTCL